MTLTGQLLCGEQPLRDWRSDCPRDFAASALDAFVDAANRNALAIGTTYLSVTLRVTLSRPVDLATYRMLPPPDFLAVCDDIEQRVALAFAVAEATGAK